MTDFTDSPEGQHELARAEYEERMGDYDKGVLDGHRLGFKDAEARVAELLDACNQKQALLNNVADDQRGMMELVEQERARCAELERERDEAREREQGWRDFTVRHPEITPQPVGNELALMQAERDAARRGLDAAVASLEEAGNEAGRLRRAIEEIDRIAMNPAYGAGELALCNQVTRIYDITCAARAALSPRPDDGEREAP